MDQLPGQPTKMTVVVQLNPRGFFPVSPTPPLTDQWRYAVVDRDGLVVSSNVAASLFQPEAPPSLGSRRIERPLEGYGGRVVLDVPGDFLTRDIVRTQIGTLVLYALVFLLLLIVNLALIQRISHAHQTLLASLRAIRERGEGTPGPALTLTGFREARLLAGEFNAMNEALIDMGRQVAEKQTTLYRLELRTKAAENEFLLAQINPHFLNNAFETIKGMAAVAAQPAIVEITGALSRIFRYSLRAETEVALAGCGKTTAEPAEYAKRSPKSSNPPRILRFRDRFSLPGRLAWPASGFLATFFHSLLGEEWETAQAYLKIQSLRFAGRFAVRPTLTPEALGCRVPKMILQPLVENAVVHGLEALASGGELHVGAFLCAGKTPEVTVADNGVGIAPEVLEPLAEALETEAPMPDRRMPIGLRNVHQRVRLAYGSGFGLSLESSRAKPSGTTVRIRIPLGGGVPCFGS